MFFLATSFDPYLLSVLSLTKTIEWNMTRLAEQEACIFFRQNAWVVHTSSFKTLLGFVEVFLFDKEYVKNSLMKKP
jgi:hypothetical protein